MTFPAAISDIKSSIASFNKDFVKIGLDWFLRRAALRAILTRLP